MPKTKAAKPKARKMSWRDTPESAIRGFLAPPNPESLHPGSSTVERAVAGDEYARSILASYAFRFPVTVVNYAL